MPLEYTKFGDKILQREEGSTEDWQEVPMDDIEEAKAEIKAQASAKTKNVREYRTPHSRIRITRADGTVEEQ